MTHPSRCRQPIINWLLVVSLISLSGCTMKLGYHWLDWWLQSKLEDYVDLTRSQRAYMSLAIDEFHEWHRYHALPAYSLFLDNIASTVQTGRVIKPEDIRQWLNQSSLFWDQSMLQMTPAASRLLLQLSRQQVEQALQTAAEEEEEFMEETRDLDKNEKIQRQIKRIRKQFKPWIGRVTENQAELIQQWAEQRRDNQLLTKQENDKWRQALLNLWESKPSATIAETRLAKLLTHPDTLWTKDYRAAVNYNRQLAVELLTHVLNSLTETQRQRLIHKLQDYRKTFDDLSGKPQSS